MTTSYSDNDFMAGLFINEWILDGNIYQDMPVVYQDLMRKISDQGFLSDVQIVNDVPVRTINKDFKIVIMNYGLGRGTIFDYQVTKTRLTEPMIFCVEESNGWKKIHNVCFFFWVRDNSFIKAFEQLYAKEYENEPLPFQETGDSRRTSRNTT